MAIGGLVESTNIHPTGPIGEYPLKFYSTIRSLAIVQLLLAVLIVLFGTGLFGFGFSASGRGIFNVDASGVWVGLTLTVACGLGVGGLGGRKGFQCPLVAYFVILIIATCLCFHLLIMTIIWTIVLNNYECTGAFIANIMLLIFTVIEVVCSIVSLGMLCYNRFCCSCCYGRDKTLTTTAVSSISMVS